MPRTGIDGTFLRFLLTGAANTLLGGVLMFGLYNLAGWPYWPSTAASYLTGGVVSFFLNKYFTFQKKGHTRRQAGRYAVTVAACYLLAYGAAKPLALRLLSGASPSFQENAAMLAGMCLFTALNYLGQRHFVFSQSR